MKKLLTLGLWCVCASAQTWIPQTPEPMTVILVSVDESAGAACAPAGIVEYNWIGGALWGCSIGSGSQTKNKFSPTWSQVTGAGSGITTLSGDISASGSGSVTATLPAILGTFGVCGDAAHVCQITSNAKGQVIAQSPITITGGGGGGGCTQLSSGLLDFVPAYSSANGGTLTYNQNATSTTPVIVGNQTSGSWQFFRGLAPGSFYATSGTTDTAYVYVATTGLLTVGTASATIVCTGCTAAVGVSAFPTSSIPLFTWAISAGQLTSSGYTDYRSFLSR